MWKIVKQIARGGIATDPAGAAKSAREAQRIQGELLAILGQALTIRQVDAGSCNGCELEIHALGNPYYNIEGWASSSWPVPLPTCCWPVRCRATWRGAAAHL